MVFSITTQLNSVKSGIATEEMIEVAKEEQVDTGYILKNIEMVLSLFQRIFQENRRLNLRV